MPIWSKRIVRFHHSNFSAWPSLFSWPYESIICGLNKLEINRDSIDKDLETNWSILTEAVQCVMKTEHIDNAYEIIKNHSRGRETEFNKETYLELVNNLGLSNENKIRLSNLTPKNYF